jgi:hypothetical protein
VRLTTIIAVLSCLSAIAALPAGAQQAAPAPSRAGYIATVDPLCKVHLKTSAAPSRKFFRAWRKGKYAPAARIMRHQSAAFDRFLVDLAAVPPPAADADLVGRWIRSLRAQLPISKRLVKALKRRQPKRAYKLLYQLVITASGRSQRLVKGIGFKSCDRI